MEKKRIVGQTAAGAPVGALVAWAWNGTFPEMQMGVEIAAALGGILGPMIKYVVSFLPHPNGEI